MNGAGLVINNDVLGKSYEVLESSLTARGKVGEFSTTMNAKGKHFESSEILYTSGTHTDASGNVYNDGSSHAASDVGIHSHATEAILTPDNRIDKSDPEPTGGHLNPKTGKLAGDVPEFKQNEMNIIVGREGASGQWIKNPTMGTESVEITQGKPTINVYDKGANLLLKLDGKAARSILEGSNNKGQKTYQKFQKNSDGSN